MVAAEDGPEVQASLFKVRCPIPNQLRSSSDLSITTAILASVIVKHYVNYGCWRLFPAGWNDQTQPRAGSNSAISLCTFCFLILMLLSFSKYLHRSSHTVTSFTRLHSTSLHPRDLHNMDALRQKMSFLTPFAKKHKVTIIGSGNW